MGMSLGPIIYTAVKPIFKIYFIIACGYWLGRRSILTVETSRNISDIIISLILPCLVFSKIVTNLENSDIKQIGIICLTYALQTLVGGLGGLMAYFVGKPKFWLGGCMSVALMPNISDLPIAYLQTFANGLVFSEDQGEKGVAYICMFTAFQIIVQFNFGFFKLIGYDIDQQQKYNESLGELEKNAEFDSDTQTDRHTTNEEDITSHISNEEDSEEEEMRQQDRIIPLTEATGMERVYSRASQVSIRRNRSQTMNELVREYSQAASMRDGTMHVVPAALTDLEAVPTQQETQKKTTIGMKAKSLFKFFLDNFKRPISISLVFSIGTAMIPWVKALFVVSDQATLPDAPDGMPPLSFVMDFATYLANACVPLGLLILGATLSRLKVSTVDRQLLMAPLLLSLVRLVILPIIGCAIIAGFAKQGWFKDDDLLRFVCSITWGLPNATSLIYLTAFYTPLEGEWRQMDVLALTYIIQYPMLSISLPFLTTYVIKAGLDY